MQALRSQEDHLSYDAAICEHRIAGWKCLQFPGALEPRRCEGEGRGRKVQVSENDLGSSTFGMATWSRNPVLDDFTCIRAESG